VNAGILLFQQYNSFRRFIHQLIAPLKRTLLYKMVAPIWLSSSIPMGARQARMYMGQDGPGDRFCPSCTIMDGAENRNKTAKV